MKGIILAGGQGSRLRPLTNVTNKHLLPVGRFPMLYYPLCSMKEAGITEIMIVTGTEHMGDLVSLLGSGRQFGLELTYRVQEEAGGIAEALGLARNFVHDQPMAVLLGDNIFEQNFTNIVNEYKQGKSKACIILKEVTDPNRFGVATLDGDSVVKITEKPKKPESNLAVTGYYLYDPSVFEFISTLKPSDRGELEITDVNNWYISQGQLSYKVAEGFWTDAGTHGSIRRAADLVEALVGRVEKSLNLDPVS